MKFLLTFLVFLIGNQSFACDCAFSTLTDSFIEADFVGRIKILKVYPNQGKEELYKADVEVLEHFKGPFISSIHVVGRSDDKFDNSCSVFYPENSDLLVAAHLTSDGKYVFGMCSYKSNFKSHYSRNQRDLDVIRALSKYDNTNTASYRSIVSPNFSLFLDSKRGIEFDEKFALFEVILDDQVHPSRVKMIKGFGVDLDAEILMELYQSTWKLHYYQESDEIIEPVKLIVPVYFYPADSKYKSILSIHDV
jgi:hypothetical protein